MVGNLQFHIGKLAWLLLVAQATFAGKLSAVRLDNIDLSLLPVFIASSAFRVSLGLVYFPTAAILYGCPPLIPKPSPPALASLGARSHQLVSPGLSPLRKFLLVLHLHAF